MAIFPRRFEREGAAEILIFKRTKVDLLTRRTPN
jgi:hypothetical protein